MQGNPLTGTSLPLESFGAEKVLAIIWTGVTSPGDVARVGYVGGGVLWEGITDKSQTYLGVNFGPDGIRAPKGVEALALDSGRIFIYFKEE